MIKMDQIKLNDDSDSEDSQSKNYKNKTEMSYRHPKDYNPLKPRHRRSKVAPIMI